MSGEARLLCALGLVLLCVAAHFQGAYCSGGGGGGPWLFQFQSMGEKGFLRELTKTIVSTGDEVVSGGLYKAGVVGGRKQR
jgi:hypothetical protein